MSDSVFNSPPAFAFLVGFGLSAGDDAAFQEASGIDPHLETGEAVEGGVNTYVHALPGTAKVRNLVLKRGYVTQGSALADWAVQTVESTLDAPIVTQNLVVALLGPNGAPLMRWRFTGAWPVKWVTGGADGGMVLTETLEIGYQYFAREAIGVG